MNGIIAKLVLFGGIIMSTAAECPWPRDYPEYGSLNSACLCAINLKNEFSIQCSAVKFPLLMRTLHRRAKNVQFDLLYINNTMVNIIDDRTFYGLNIKNIQLSFCSIKNITDRAFESLEEKLHNLNLQDNLLRTIPSRALADLKTLSLLDLSGNRIKTIPDRAFMGMRINTLKLSRNQISIYPDAFGGLETHLKNLNLKACGLPLVPSAIRSLKSLAFLDLAQNEIAVLEEGGLATLDSLTALNLERNHLQELEMDVFKGVTDTLSSLSLLNNQLVKFPLEAINSLPLLRVLDIGFNLISDLPKNAFHELNKLTLLAVDGNPLQSIPESAFAHLNGTLRGLSVGGLYFACDCHALWISNWVKNSDLQVTSRDKNPQFCGYPERLSRKSFYEIEEEEFECPPDTKLIPEQNGKLEEQSLHMEASTVVEVNQVEEKLAHNEETQTTTMNPILNKETTTTKPYMPSSPNERTNDVVPVKKRPHMTPTIKQQTKLIRGPPLVKTTSADDLQNTKRGQVSKSLRRKFKPENPEEYYSMSRSNLLEEEVILQNAYWAQNSISIQWDSEVSNILGFRVVYRLFGDDYFKLAQPLASNERDFKIKNVPANEYFVVCVVSLEETDIKPSNVPYNQCREIRTGDPSTTLSTHMDTIIIAASAAICGTVVLAVIVFICCNRSKRSDPEKQGIPTVMNTSSTPLTSFGGLGSTKTDWDTISMYSQRSIPRARMYHQNENDDARSHISRMSTRSRSRSFADGQSQRSFSGMNGFHHPIGPFVNPLALSRPDLRLSRQSLVASQFGGNFAPFGNNAGLISRAASHRSERRRSRSKSRDRSSSRLSHAGSSHSLTGYDTDGWTDHDMDIYMARNPTRGGLVQL